MIDELFDLKNKVAIVTGGTGHLGKSICEGLAEAGAHVYLTSRSKSKAIKTKNNFSNKIRKNISVETLDILSSKSINESFNRIKNCSEKIDILVNNAAEISSGNYENISEKEWNKTIDGTINGVYRCTKEIVPLMKENQSGSIINISSIYGNVAPDNSIYGNTGLNSLPSYGAGKAAIIQYTKFMAGILGKEGIRVNSVSPGAFPTADIQNKSKFLTKLKKKIPLGRVGKPHELKGIMVYLGSDSSSYVTGTNIMIDGGWTTW
tara:strand:+ start:767 stop:1555 length:789 start_codon:yes stop_codon:yes gene_type:complete